MSRSKEMYEEMRRNRSQVSREKLRFWEEVRMVPRWLVWLVIALFVIALVVAQVVNLVHQIFPDLPTRLAALALAGVVTAAGIVVALLVFLWAYVNRDAKRRGMSPTLWTLLAIFIPYFLGVIAYFLMRKPLPFNCPRCGETVIALFNFCPNCKYNLHPTCPQCRHEVRAEDHYCPNCAFELAGVPQQKA